MATPVFLPGEFHGQRSLAAYSPWSRKELNTTEQLTHTHTHTHSLSLSLSLSLSHTHTHTHRQQPRALHGQLQLVSRMKGLLNACLSANCPVRSPGPEN